MYICICNALNDKTVRKALNENSGHPTPARVYSTASGGKAPSCGKCLECVKEMIMDHRFRSGEGKAT